MTTYARLDPLTGALSAQVDLTPEQYAALQANGKAVWLRLYVVDVQPVPSATQKVIEGVPLITATEYHQTWALANKRQDQLDAEAQAATLVQLKAMATALQNDIAAGVTAAPTTLAGVVTDVQDLKRRALRTDRVLLWLLKQQ